MVIKLSLEALAKTHLSPDTLLFIFFAFRSCIDSLRAAVVAMVTVVLHNRQLV